MATEKKTRWKGAKKKATKKKATSKFGKEKTHLDSDLSRVAWVSHGGTYLDGQP